MRRLVPVLLVLFALTGCTFTSNVSSCSNGSCNFTLTGAQSVTLQVDGADREMEVGPIRPGSVTVSVRGDEATIDTGESATVDGITVEVVSVNGDEVKLVVS